MTDKKPDRAFILAAGKGTRLRPHTETLPKPLVAVGGQPLLGRALDKLQQAGITAVTINGWYLADKIETYVQARTDMNIAFSRETELLDTGGGVKNALETMEGTPFYLINGDALWSDGPNRTALERLAAAWNPDIMDILLLLIPLDTMIMTPGTGDYDLSPDGKAIRSKDKTGTTMFGGIRIVKPDIFDSAPDGPFSFLNLMDAAQEKGRLHGLLHDGGWYHISTPQDLDTVNTALASGTLKL